jgi:hypothetical protein
MSLGSDYTAEMAADYEVLTESIRQSAADEVWTTKSGQKISLKDMDILHLENTIKYLERVDTTDMMLPWIVAMKKELNRRKQCLIHF